MSNSQLQSFVDMNNGFNSFTQQWFKDGYIDGLFVKPYVMFMGLAGIVGWIWTCVIWQHHNNHSTILYIFLGILILMLYGLFISVLYAFMVAKLVQIYWNWRLRKLHALVHGQDKKQYKGQGSLSYWWAWSLVFMWVSGINRHQLRDFKREYQLALARRMGYS